MKTKDIRELSIEKIEAKLKDLRQESLDLRLRKQALKIEKPHKFSMLRKDIARMETVLKEKKDALAA